MTFHFGIVIDQTKSKRPWDVQIKRDSQSKPKSSFGPIIWFVSLSFFLQQSSVLVSEILKSYFFMYQGWIGILFGMVSGVL